MKVGGVKRSAVRPQLRPDRFASRVYRWTLRDRRAPTVPVRAFTLVELLVVVAIIALLTGLAMSMVGTARRSGQRINTEATLRTVHAALRLFQHDVGVLPWQAQADAGPQGNGLARRLGRTLDAAGRGDLNAASAIAAGKYSYNCDLNPWSPQEHATQPSALTIRSSWAGSILSNAGIEKDRVGAVTLAYVANRLFMLRARQAVQAGALDLPGPVVTRPGAAAPLADLTGTPLLTTADGVAAGTVGWCDDYLDGALEAGRIRGDDILDAFGNPIILVSQNLPKVHSSLVQIGFGSISGFDSSWFGLGAVGFRPGTGPWSDVLLAKRWRLLSMGRIRLSASDAGDGQPTPAHASLLPDSAHPLGSDRRFYAAPGLETDCELWSAGPGGSFSWMRDAKTNLHAIPFSPIYDRGLR